MRTRYSIALACLATSALPLLMTGCGGDSPSGPSVTTWRPPQQHPQPFRPGIRQRSSTSSFGKAPMWICPRGAPPGLSNAVASISKLFSLPTQKLDELRARGKSRSGKALPDLNLWVAITLQPGTDAAAFLEELKRLPSVEIAEPAPLPAPPPAITPDFSGNQGYLDAAPGGIDARVPGRFPEATAAASRSTTWSPAGTKHMRISARPMDPVVTQSR